MFPASVWATWHPKVLPGCRQIYTLSLSISHCSCWCDSDLIHPFKWRIRNVSSEKVHKRRLARWSSSHTIMNLKPRSGTWMVNKQLITQVCLYLRLKKAQNQHPVLRTGRLFRRDGLKKRWRLNLKLQRVAASHTSKEGLICLLIKISRAQRQTADCVSAEENNWTNS